VSNPMKAPCGLENCDCGHTINRLVLALANARDVVHRTHCQTSNYYGRFPPQCWKECEEAMDAMLEAGWMPLDVKVQP